MSLSILYRGPLSSCNYDCPYCPFRKHRESRAELARDAAALERFVTWIERRPSESVSILFTPWGEALVRRSYRTAIARLSHVEHVDSVAIQTNLSAPLGFLDHVQRERVAFWATYHPGQTTRSFFLRQCAVLLERGIRFSVGVVGLTEHAEEIRALRSSLPSRVYLWINAVKSIPGHLRPETRTTFSSIDPLFGWNAEVHPSLGRSCRTGESVISVDGDGNVRRCHFVPEILGNIYEDGWEAARLPRTCPNETCGCHIGYVHMPELGLDRIFGRGLLPRIPSAPMRLSGAD